MRLKDVYESIQRQCAIKFELAAGHLASQASSGKMHL